MKLFKRKVQEQKHGKGSEDIVSLRKELDVLNYTPLDYKYSKEFTEFLQTCKDDFEKSIQIMNLDDLNEDALDNYIEAQINKMKEEAGEQRTYHMNVIKFYKGIIDGELVRARGHYENLQEDLNCIEQEISVYREIQKEKRIFS